MFKSIHNQDPNNLHNSVKEPLVPKHVDAMVDNITNSGVDAILINSNAEVANHPSSVIGTYEDMFDGDPAKTTIGDVPQSYWDTFANDKRQFMSLKNLGCDYLERALKRSRERGLVSGISVRMNDMHGGASTDAPSHGPFFKQHPECRIMIDDYCHGLDYEQAAVRKLMTDYVKELKDNYEFDLMELDWIRFRTHFHPGRGYKNRSTITDFMSEIRELLGEEKTLMVRIHMRPEAALKQGLDIAEWAKKDLVDILSPSPFFSLRLDFPIEAYRRLTNDRLRVFACIDDTDGTGQSILQNNETALGGLAGACAAGSDGVEFFNQFFGADKKDPKIQKRKELIAEMSGSSFRKSPKQFSVAEKPKFWSIGCDLPWQLPVAIENNSSKAFTLIVAKPSSEAKCEIELLINGEVDITKWQVAINDFPSSCSPILIGEDDGSNIISFEIESQFIQDGTNTLLVHCFADTKAKKTITGLNILTRG